MFKTEITLKPPFSFERLLRRLESHPDQQLHVDAGAGTLQRAFRLGEQKVLTTLAFRGDLEAPVLHIGTDRTLSGKQQEELIGIVRHMFNANMDLELLYGHMEQDESLGSLAKRFRGLRFLLDSDLFQSMIRTIIGQQLNLAFAATLTHRLIERAGDFVDAEDGRRFLLFPTPEALARLEVGELRELQFSQRKAEYVIDFARAVVEGKVDLDEMTALPDEEVIERLSRLRGIGRWTVECLLMFGMGRPDLLPAADIGLRNGIQLVYGLQEKPTEQEIRRIGESWAPYRSYVSLYVWEAVGEAKRAAKKSSENEKKTL